MKVTHSVRYDASVDEVRAMLMDPAFREKATAEQGVISAEVSVSGGSVTIDLVRPADDVPSFARKFTGDSVSMRQAEEWDGDSADFSIGTSGVPAGISGRRSLVADGTGCRDEFEGEAKARIPLVGGKLERLMAEKLTEAWDTEHGVGVAWLGGER